MNAVIVSLLLLIFTVIGLFQNCSEQKIELSQIVESLDVDIPSSQLKVSICPEVSFLEDDNNKFLFILDMSRSNIGNFRKEERNIGGSKYPVYFWEPSQGSDVKGARFDAIEKFIASCASSENNQFAIIGFGEEAGSVLIDSRNRPYLSCEEPIRFVGKDEALQNLETYRDAENYEANYYSQWVDQFYDEEPSQSSVSLAYTSYSAASRCAKKIIFDDLLGNYGDNVDRYQALFISDGRPEDSTTTTQSCANVSGEAQDKCYIDNLLDPFTEVMRDVAAVRRELNILPIAYGIKKDEDLKFLDALAGIRNQVRSERLDNFENNANILCDLISSQHGVETNSSTIMSTVLTLGMRNGQYIVDSDMDGVYDIDEVNLGYDPQNSRSQVGGVLDGVCELLGGISQCYEVKEKVVCNEGKMLQSGFSDCDIKVLQEAKKKLNLDDDVDWDDDGVPNFIEVVKGTDPFLNDMNDDPDNDLLTTRYELIRSKNPFEHEGLTSKSLKPVKVVNEISQEDDSCKHRTRHIVIEEIPFVKSLAVTDGLGGQMAHQQNEHIVAVFSSRVTQNFSFENKGIIGGFVKYRAHQSTAGPYLVPDKHELFNEDLGEWKE